MSHTPGPWKYRQLYSHGHWLVGGSRVMAEDSRTICTFHNRTAEKLGANECIANAQLIAAAPDLLAACRQAQNFFANGLPVYVGSLTHRAIADAVRKATGLPLQCDHNERMVPNDDPQFPWKCARCGYVYGKDER